MSALKVAGLTANECGALNELARFGGLPYGDGVALGDGAREISPTYEDTLVELQRRGMVDVVSEHGSLAADPGRWYYELTERGDEARQRANAIVHEIKSSW